VRHHGHVFFDDRIRTKLRPNQALHGIEGLFRIHHGLADGVDADQTLTVFLVNPTTEGVVRAPSAFSIHFRRFWPSIRATQELVVPKSIRLLGHSFVLFYPAQRRLFRPLWGVLAASGSTKTAASGLFPPRL